jgi:lysophospholipase L1-like esterase
VTARKKPDAPGNQIICRELKQERSEPLIVITLTIAILTASSLFHYRGTIGPFHVSNIDLSLRPRAADATARSKTAGSTPKISGKQLRSAVKPPDDTVGAPVSTRPRKIEGPKRALDHFCRSLQAAENNSGRTRIAYFGDSIIEGDLITQDLRKNLQGLFGGRGIGFVPIVSVAARSRNTIRHTFSTNWRSVSLHPKYDNRYDLGISGFAFLPTIESAVNALNNSSKANSYKHSWVEYQTSKLQKNMGEFPVVSLYYGNVSDFGFIRYRINDLDEKVVTLQKSKSPMELTLSTDGSAQKVRINFFSRGSMQVYGVSFDDRSGVYVDNFSIRGYSGTTLNRLSPQVLDAFDKHLSYSLVVIQYGANITAFTTRKEFDWYAKQMTEAIEHLKKCFPEAAFLIVGVNDIAARQNGAMATKSCIPLLVNAQKSVARRTKVAFFNLYEAMGGENSMVSWVEDKKPLASKDYTHFNHRGAKRVADLLTSALISEYRLFKTVHPTQENGR